LDEGFAEFREGESTPERVGRRKLYVTITAPGRRALQQSLGVVDAVHSGVLV
jgi:hypothetical protein